MREKTAKATPDVWIAQLAARQHGVVSAGQLIAAGLTYEAIRRRVRTGRLHRIFRGVYAVGHRNLTDTRTILDLRRVLDREELEAAIARAEVLRLPIGDLAGFLREPTRSELERRFLRLCARHGLPKPEVNVRIGPYEVDFLWRDHGIAVETDGWETHRHRSAFEADRARDGELKTRGYDVLRFTYRQVWHQDALVASRLRALLNAGRAWS